MRQIVLDTETTGLSAVAGHRMIEIGCIELLDRRVTQRTFHHYLNPDRDIEKAAQAVHGIKDEFLRDKPRFEEIASAFLDFIRDAEVIIHNAAFDVGFIEAELKRTAIRPATLTNYCQVIDTLKLARQRHPGQQNNLDALCRRYHISNKHRDWHGALLDAELLAQVYLLMTGGQASLFGEGSESSSGTAGDASKQRGSRVADPIVAETVVIYADDKALSAHEDFMQIIKTAHKHHN